MDYLETLNYRWSFHNGRAFVAPVIPHGFALCCKPTAEGTKRLQDELLCPLRASASQTVSMNPDLPAISLAAVPGRRRATLDLAREIEDRGFAGIYCPSFGDAMGLCQALALVTTSIEFGTSIVNIYSRNAMDYAQSAAFIHETSDGRFRFGVGVSHAPANDRLGVTTGPPLADMRRFVEDVGSASRVGDQPPIVLAAMRDRMVGLAAEVGQGMVFANAARSEFAGTLARMPDAGGSDEFFIGGMIPTCISDDREAAAAVNRKTLIMYLHLPNYRNYWKQAGYMEEMEAVEAAIEAGDRDALPSLMTEEWLKDVTLYGSRHEVLEGLQAWYDAGLTTPILVPSSASGGQLKAFEEVFALFESRS
jgi:alkanesulfonate monooxygenase SsuD/methylene tetrahydromethanopterin reductase-like flavin-dependent oxidoreductase (luciferase family)